MTRRDAIEDVVEQGDDRGLAAQQERLIMEGQARVRSATAAMLGSTEKTIDAYQQFLDTMTKGLGSDTVKAAIDGLAEGFGKIGIAPWAATIAGDANMSEKASAVGDMLKVLGAPPTVVGLLKAGQAGKAIFDMMKQIGESDLAKDADGILGDIRDSLKKEQDENEEGGGGTTLDWSKIVDMGQGAMKVIIENVRDFDPYRRPSDNNNNNSPSPDQNPMP